MTGHIRRRNIAALVLGAALLAVACGKEESRESPSEGVESDQGSEAASVGRTIVVEAYSDANGSYYKPNVIKAHRGDIIRLTLMSGVHNINFLADSNPGKTGLPPVSDMLQAPGQTLDVKVSFDAGRYYFQCDPHVALGMIGHLTVED